MRSRRSFETMLLLGAMVVGLGMAAPAPAQEFTIDPAHSYVGFGVKHMMVATVRGSFAGVEGTITLDLKNPEKSSVVATVDAATIDTNNNDRDAHLKSADFFDVAKHPKITFTSTSVSKTGEDWVAQGVLDMHGVKREVAVNFRLLGPVKDPWGNTRLGVDVDPLKIDRQDFGLTWNKVLDGGGVVVGNTVTVTLSVEAVQKKDEAAKE